MDHSKPDISAEVKAEQIRQLYNVYPATALTTIIYVVILFIIQWPVISHKILVIWLAAFATTIIARALVWRRYKQTPPDESVSERWGNYYLVGTLAGGLAWGFAGVFLFPENNMMHQVFVTFVLAGTSAVSVTALSYQRAPAAVFMAACMFPVIFMYLQIGTTVSITMGAMLLMYFIVLIFASKRIYRNTHQNITLRIEATVRETLLQRAQQGHLMHVEQTPLGVIEWNTQFQITKWNPAAEEIFGYSQEEALGRRALELLIPENAHSQVAAIWNALLSKKGGERSSHQNITREGRIIDCVWHNTPLVNSEGVLVGVASIIQDITEIKESANALLLAKREAEYANKSKSEFLANMSHEIRTPLNGALSMATLLERTPLNAEQREYVDAITFSGEALLTIINDVLDISKIEAGKLQLDISEFELRPIVENTINLLAARADEKGNSLHCDIDKSIPPVLVGDSARLRQILFNLIGNAIKFTERGDITVEVNQNESGPGSDKNSDISLTFRITDNGIGIAEAALPNLFDSFTQADASTSRVFGGSGLGLTICHRLIEMMQGTIYVESREGLGSTFWFELKLMRGKKEIPTQEKIDAVELPRALNILLVEDDRINQIAESRLLQQEGHKVTIASDGFAALDILGRYQSSDNVPFDVILVDIHMPGLSGQETTTRIRKMAAPIGTLPIIALTADVTVKNIRECSNAGIDKTLSKPINIDELTQAMGTLYATPMARSQ